MLGFIILDIHLLLYANEKFSINKLYSSNCFLSIHLRASNCFLSQHLRAQYDKLFPALCNEHPDIFPPELYTWEQFLWACELWYSNSMKIMFADGKLRTCLIPIAGFLNHSVCHSFSLYPNFLFLSWFQFKNSYHHRWLVSYHQLIITVYPTWCLWIGCHILICILIIIKSKNVNQGNDLCHLLSWRPFLVEVESVCIQQFIANNTPLCCFWFILITDIPTCSELWQSRFCNKYHKLPSVKTLQCWTRMLP